MNLLTLIPSIIGLFAQVFPNASQSEHDKFQLALQALLSEANIQQEQIRVNVAQAQSTNWFIAGARPYVMWVCGLAFSLQYFILPLSIWFATIAHQDLVVHQLQTIHLDPALIYTLNGLLGLNTITRSFEKYTGIQTNH